MSDARVLIVDDEPGMLEVCRDALALVGDLEVHTECDSIKAASLLDREDFDVLVADIRMPGLGGVDLIRSARATDPHLSAVMMTAYPSVDSAVASMRGGAVDYLSKPFTPEELISVVKRIVGERRLRAENVLLSRHLERTYQFDEMVGDCPAMRRVYDLVDRIAPTDTEVLITGESGTGKELVARSVHGRSRRSTGRFVPVDCGAIPENLFESEIFGHERGAFTGATESSIGLLEYAEGGTLFLDEITEMSAILQAKLLRAVQEKSFRRIGGRSERRISVRILAATNRDVDDEVQAGRFRKDLYYRLNVVRIDLPPLRVREGDVPHLIRHMLTRLTGEMGKPIARIDQEAVEILTTYHWPGNVRQLQNVLRRAVALSATDCLTVDDLPDDVVMQSVRRPSESGGGFFQLRSRHTEEFERKYLRRLLEQTRGDVTQVARIAGIPRGTVYRLLKKVALAADDFRS